MSYKKQYEALLKEFEQYKKESIKWGVQDFMLYDHMTHTINEKQSQEALESMIRNHDATIGISWDTIQYYISEFGTLKA
tara:strand:- start:314 stop:550 length:237 start_codon:yes stop_codon:yes gene_type:complete